MFYPFQPIVYLISERLLKTNRDEWVYDFSKITINDKAKLFAERYLAQLKSKSENLDSSIKWSRDLENKLKSGVKVSFDEHLIKKSLWRPFVKKNFYSEKAFSDVMTWNHVFMFGSTFDNKNLIINISGLSAMKPFQVLSSNIISDYEFVEKNICLPLYVYDSNSENPNQNHENITDWGLTQFQTHYKSAQGEQITKQDIFYYTYAVLHSPVYRKKYEQNLKREFPRLPFYDDFFQWANWGKELMDLHINYESAKPFALERKDLDLTPKLKIKQEKLFGSDADSNDEPFISAPKTKLRADKESGEIEIDSHTTLSGVPSLAWEYKLGNRSAIEWILDQYKEKTPQDATIREKFNVYKFADYKEQVIDLLNRVTTVSVKTMEIVNQMPNE